MLEIKMPDDTLAILRAARSVYCPSVEDSVKPFLTQESRDDTVRAVKKMTKWSTPKATNFVIEHENDEMRELVESFANSGSGYSATISGNNPRDWRAEYWEWASHQPKSESH